MGRARGLTLERNLYYSAKFVAQVAQNLMLAALFVVAGTSSHAAIGLSSLFIATLIPAILFGFLGGAVVDRMGPARGFVLGSVLRFLTVFGALVLMMGPGSAWMVAFVYSTVSQLSSPAEMALVRTIREGSSAPAHSLIVALQYGGQGLGIVVLAPALYWFGGAQAILTGSVVGFFLLTALTAWLSLRLRATPAGHMQPVRDAFSFRETVRFFHGQALARDAVTVLAVKAMVAQGIVVALPMYLKHDMGLGREAMVFLLIPGIIGTAAGLFWAGRNVTRARAAATMRWAMAGMIVAVFALAALDYGIIAVAEYSHVPPIVNLEASLNTTFVVALPAAFLIGLALSGALVSARVALTETAPIGQQARVYAVQTTLTDAIVVLPLLLLGVGVQFAGARTTLAAMGILASLAFVAIEHPRFKMRPLLEPLLLPGPVPVLIESSEVA